MPFKTLLHKLGFAPKDNTSGVYHKKYASCDSYCIEVDFEAEKFNYGQLILSDSKTTLNFSQKENWVVLECVDRLLEKGYKPQNIKLEKTWATGHGTSGRLDVLVTRDDGSAYLMIECKNWGAEFEKELKRIHKDGGQLFTYFQQDRSANVLMLYASELDSKGNIHYRNEIIKIEEDYRQTTNVKDFYDRWDKIPRNNGVFDAWVAPYDFQSKALTPKSLKEIRQEDSSFIFNRFLEILRHNVVSDKPNAFNKIFTLFLCKIYDEKSTRPTDELAFQWKEGVDDHISFQKRLTDLYRKGMKEFLEKEVSDMSDEEFEIKFGHYINDEATKQRILDQLTELRLKKNNEFAIKEVFDDASFEDNAIVVKKVVELLQGYKIRYTKRHQYLSDFFEMLLTTGLKQESGQFFTPVPVAQFIIKSIPIDTLVMDKLHKGDADDLLPAIIDYAAGSGHFLTESMHEIQGIINKINPDDFIEKTAKELKKWHTSHFDWAFDYVYGIEKDYRLVKVGKVGCYLHGDGLAQVIHGDGLANFSSSEYKGRLKHKDKYFTQENKQFDIVISNPPYSVSAFKGTLKDVENEFDLYGGLTDQSSQIECLFIERTKQLLKDGGIAGIILPSSILSNTGIYTKAREIILKYFEIVAIAELGSNTFMATGTNTVTLFLRRRSNDLAEKITVLAEKAIADAKDITVNGIEKSLGKYVSHVWESISMEDYFTLLKRVPNDAIEAHELYKDYRKKLKAKNEKEFWDMFITLETEKFIYFVLAYPQTVVLVKSGDKDAEKRFLGYEFSNRRGSEGIHPIQRGKTIDECTKLFDADAFDNPEKASTYVYKAFQGDLTAAIDESLQNNITRHNLADMLTFDRVEFEKNISLAVKKKVRIESRWDKVKISEILVALESGKRPKGGVGEYQDGIPSLGGEHIDLNGKISLNNMKYVPVDYFQKSNQGTLNDLDILICKDGALTGKVALFLKSEFPYEEGMVNEHVFILRTGKILTQKYLFNLLYSEKGQEILRLNITGTAQGGLNRENLFNIQIPLPGEDIQKKIVAEIEVLESRESIINSKIISGRRKIDSTMSSSSGTSKKLSEICNMRAGKFVSPSDIEPVKSSGLYPCYGGNGLRGYTNTFTHEGTFPLIGRQGALCGNVCMAIDKFHATEHAVVAVPASEVNVKWLYYRLKMMNLNQYATGTAQPGLSVQRIGELSVTVPSFEEQQDIIFQIEAIEIEIELLKKELESIPSQKEAILKKYL